MLKFILLGNRLNIFFDLLYIPGLRKVKYKDTVVIVLNEIANTVSKDYLSFNIFLLI